MLDFKVGDLVLSDHFEGIGVILTNPKKNNESHIHFVKIKFYDSGIKYFTVQNAIRARQRFLDATTNR